VPLFFSAVAEIRPIPEAGGGELAQDFPSGWGAIDTGDTSKPVGTYRRQPIGAAATPDLGNLITQRAAEERFSRKGC
jgi:hypothetical protein